MCIDLASDTIDAILAYMRTRPNPIPFGLNAIECIVEAVCHLVPHLRPDRNDYFARPESSVREAIDFLEKSAEQLGVARRALNALGEVADRIWLNVESSNHGQSFEFTAVPARVLRSTLNDWFSADWAEMCLSLPVVDSVVEAY